MRFAPLLAGVEHSEPISEIKKLFGDEAELLLTGLMNVNRFSDKRRGGIGKLY